MSSRKADSVSGSGASRSRRVGEQIRRELAQPLQRCASEAGLGMVTLSAVDVSPDLRDARLFVTQLGPALDHATVIARLGRYVGRLRAVIARNLRLRVVPRLSLRFDESIERGARIDALLEAAGGAPATGSDEQPE